MIEHTKVQNLINQLNNISGISDTDLTSAIDHAKSSGTMKRKTVIFSNNSSWASDTTYSSIISYINQGYIVDAKYRDYSLNYTWYGVLCGAPNLTPSSSKIVFTGYVQYDSTVTGNPISYQISLSIDSDNIITQEISPKSYCFLVGFNGDCQNILGRYHLPIDTIFFLELNEEKEYTTQQVLELSSDHAIQAILYTELGLFHGVLLNDSGNFGDENFLISLDISGDGPIKYELINKNANIIERRDL